MQSSIRRLQAEFDNVAVEADMLEDGEVIEVVELERAPPSLDRIIVSHILEPGLFPIFDCPICFDENIPSSKRVTISCNHSYCMPCTIELLKTCQQDQKNATCPLCRYPCFLLETPDEQQYEEIGKKLEEFSEKTEEDTFDAFIHHFFHF
jgi:hypothetical protein